MQYRKNLFLFLLCHKLIPINVKFEYYAQKESKTAKINTQKKTKCTKNHKVAKK